MAAVFKNLLLATEHTEFDSGAEKVALDYARQFGLSLPVVFPLFSNPEFEAVAPQLAEQADQDAADKLAAFSRLAQASSVEATLSVRRGQELYREIVADAGQRGTDLLFVRIRGKRSFLANLLLGEMVSKVLSHAPCHVLMAPQGASLWHQGILVAAESTPQGLRLVEFAARQSAASSLPLHIVSVQSGDPSLLEATHTFLQDAAMLAQGLGVTVTTELATGKPHSEILAAAQRCGADLIVIGSRDDASIHLALVGGVAQKVLGLSACPVLVIHPSLSLPPRS